MKVYLNMLSYASIFTNKHENTNFDKFWTEFGLKRSNTHTHTEKGSIHWSFYNTGDGDCISPSAVLKCKDLNEFKIKVHHLIVRLQMLTLSSRISDNNTKRGSSRSSGSGLNSGWDSVTQVNKGDHVYLYRTHPAELSTGFRNRSKSR